MELVSRKQAQALGLPHYFTGKPCSRGHVCERYTNSATCCECGRACSRDFRRQYAKEHPEEHPKEFREALERLKQWRLANPDRVREAARRWRLDNAEKILEGNRQWRRKNLDKARKLNRERNRRYRNKLRAARTTLLQPSGDQT